MRHTLLALGGKGLLLAQACVQLLLRLRGQQLSVLLTSHALEQLRNSSCGTRQLRQQQTERRERGSVSSLLPC
jgi:hypothetical protein